MKKVAAAVFTAAATAILAIGTIGIATAEPAPATAGAVHNEPWHDPHCTRDGRWHEDPQDHTGRPDPRCPHW